MRNLYIVLGVAMAFIFVAGFTFVMDSSLPLSQKDQTPEQLLDTFLTEHVNIGDSPRVLQIQTAYRFALLNSEGVLDDMPCYCGCMEHSGHESNRDCFIEKDDERKGGELFDEMGLNCGMCVAIALETKRLFEAGYALPEIQRLIDERFKPAV